MLSNWNEYPRVKSYFTSRERIYSNLNKEMIKSYGKNEIKSSIPESHQANFLVLAKDIIIQTRVTNGNSNIQMEEERIQCLREEKGLRFKTLSMFIDKDKWTVYTVTRNKRDFPPSNFFLFRMRYLHGWLGMYLFDIFEEEKDLHPYALCCQSCFHVKKIK